MSQAYLYPTHPPRSHQVARRWALRVILLLALLFLAFFVYKVSRIALSLQRGYDSGAALADLLHVGLTDENFPLAQHLLSESVAAIAAAHGEITFFAPAFRWAGRLPVYGPTLAALPILADTGNDLSQLAQDGFPLLRPFVVAPAGQTGLRHWAVAVSQAQPEVTALLARATAIEERLASIPLDDLRLGLAEPVAGVNALLALLQAGLQLSAATPELLGIAEPRTYLILVQNNHELRATGGFITSVGRLIVAQGQIIGLEFYDSYAIDRADLPHPAPPPPLQRYMQIDQLLLRDVNWSPDLPTTARLAQLIYQQTTGRTIDGIVTLDLHAVELFVGALEPVVAAAVAGEITQANFVSRAQELWAAPPQSEATLAANSAEWWRQRKDFIPLVAQAVLARLQSGDFNALWVAQALHQALEQRAIQIWMVDRKLATTFAQLHWDGSLQPSAGADFLALVESNLGYNKVNAVVERQLDYGLSWPDGPGQPGVATATLTYRHPLTTPDPGCDPRPRYGLTYAEMMARCYFSFVRLYVPAGSELIDLSGVAPDSILNQHGEANTQVFGGYFVLPPGEERRITIRYRLPPPIQPTGYQLVVQRQSGSLPLPLHARIAGQTLATTMEAGRFVWSSE